MLFSLLSSGSCSLWVVHLAYPLPQCPVHSFLRHPGYLQCVHLCVQKSNLRSARWTSQERYLLCKPAYPCIPSGKRDLTPKKLHTDTQQHFFLNPVCLGLPVGPASFLPFKGLSSEASTINVLQVSVLAGSIHCCCHATSKEQRSLSLRCLGFRFAGGM